MKYAFAKRVRHLQSSAVRDILKIVNQGNVISFAGGLPDDDLFPVAAIEDAFSRALSKGKKAMQYGETEGYFPLREVIIERMKNKGIQGFTPEHVLLTTGSQQAIDLFSRIMIGPGDVIFTEEPTYLAALQVFQSYEAKIVPIRCDANGMDLDDLQEKAKVYRPKVVYVVPTFSNPSGRVWSLERREALVRLAHKQNFIVFEDDPYGDIQYHDAGYTPMAALDDGSHVVYTSTFSKTAVPALRTGWIVGPYQIIRMMAQAKQANDLHSNSLAHQALYELCMNFDLDAHIQKISDLYGHRKNVMVDAIRSSGLKTAEFVDPEGGMFLWLEVDPRINTDSLLKEAVRRGIAYVPGAPFYAGTPQYNTLRLNYTHATDEQIGKGMQIMTDLFAQVEEEEDLQIKV
ncbi:PLP-dependent aminotransferase family protein [Geomicrobium sp. JCM 19039]|uniref:aminotransferase-like domain-containing protein n=1 Tax=Geomicrobium sp. JCM 19039 TaxID=1460636 RepID=UPI00045F32ED|nr:PLP-dependent aminotransferase family protein [Geomicrobium sp. JCM 19039]GAK11771.1 aspartate aminotransferase [Geomicrobium sp. JCM 19039]